MLPGASGLSIGAASMLGELAAAVAVDAGLELDRLSLAVELRATGLLSPHTAAQGLASVGLVLSTPF